ncbi:MAG: hypothetical protein IT557_18975 [Alphaproteobacteria bacterium]|nr:hypothetical protein [Alphaproteobacteria bacterium]
MRRLLVLLVLAGLVALLLGAVVLGTVPLPAPARSVEKVIPNDRIGR